MTLAASPPPRDRESADSTALVTVTSTEAELPWATDISPLTFTDE